MFDTPRAALLATLVALAASTLDISSGLDLGLDGLLNDPLSPGGGGGGDGLSADDIAKSVLGGGGGGKSSKGSGSNTKYGSYLSAIQGYIVLIEDTSGTLIYTGPKNFAIVSFNPIAGLTQKYITISLNGPTIFAVESDETTFVELSLEEFGLDNLKMLVKMKDSILRRLKPLALGRPILDYDDEQSSYSSSSNAYSGSSSSSYGGYSAGPSPYGASTASSGLSSYSSGSSGPIAVFHQKDDSIANDIYILDYVGNLNAIYSGSVGTYLRDGYSIIYRNQLTWTYRRSDFPYTINRIVRLGDNVISVFDDYSVLAKTVKILDPTEFGVYMRANSEVGSLIQEDSKVGNLTTNLLQGSTQDQVSDVGQDVLQTAGSLARGLNKLDRYSFSLDNSTSGSSDY